MIFDISNHIVHGGRPRREEIIAWLSNNVGEFYGVGDRERSVVAIGKGWEMYAHSTVEPFTDDLIIGWELDITDDAKSMMFALRWVNGHESISE